MGWYTNSCCCFSLRTGSLILGYCSFISQFFSSSFLILQIIDAKTTMDELIKQEHVPGLPDTEVQHHVIYAYLITCLGTLLITSLAHGVISVILLLGVYREKEKYLQIVVYAWVAFNFVGAMGGCARSIYQFGLGAYTEAGSLLILTIIGVLFGSYYTAVIHSYKKEVKEGKNNSKLIPTTQA